MRCNSHVWPAGGVIGLYLTRGVSEEVTDVRNDLTERQTLRSKPERNKTQQEALKKHELTTDSRVQTHELFTHTLSVEMRQRQSPSLVRLFLCLKPPIIRSHTNWKHRVQRLKWSDSDRSPLADPADVCVLHLWVCSLVHDLQQQRLVLVPDLVLGVS